VVTGLKVVILAGGRGSRLSEETDSKPKPMVEIGGRPILWHIMKYYSHYDFNEFFVAVGYKGEMIKRFFLDYSVLNSSMTVNLADGLVTPQAKGNENWKVHLIDTGLETNTGGRLGRLGAWLRDEPFMMTYGDGLSNVDLHKLLAFHRAHRKLATVTAVRPPARFGALELDGDIVRKFSEKSQMSEGWINGGFFVFEPGIFKYIRDDNTSLEKDALERIALEGHLVAFKHEDFFQPMDTLRDVRLLDGAWASGKPPWRVWL
jgi:glucose-1-phosphate cytidylyltransferase